ncbi:hypothetical protein BKI52_00370 [marine bacterium AO1-C]|nr:hypothetical protein BKI52_00370 [marine bacterium AO1-C]
MKYLFKTSLLPIACYASVLALLVACGGSTKDNNTETNTDSVKANTKVDSSTSSTGISTSTNNDIEEDSQPAISTNVESYYNIWVKKLIEDAKKAGMPDAKPEIQVKDIPNGYMKVGMMPLGVTGYNTMTLWAAQNGETTFGVLSHGCGPVCGSGTITFYELVGQQLKDVTEKVFSTKKQIALAKKAQEKMPKNAGSDNVDFWTVLPQKGTTIQMGIMSSNLSNDKTKMIQPIAELQYNVADNTFKLVEK